MTTLTVHSATCGFCDQGGQWVTPAARDQWKQDHFAHTGHDSNWFEQDWPAEHAHIPHLITARFAGTCKGCGTRFDAGAAIAPAPYSKGYHCIDCATQKATEAR